MRRPPGGVLTPEQLRAARVLIRWSRERLAEESDVSLKTTQAFEQGRVASPLMTTEHKWRRALEKAGVIFVDPTAEHGPGVILKHGKLR
jgi:transcriptional regulator with XRE-family HTH domain